MGRTVLFANGIPKPGELEALRLRLRPTDKVVALDGGADHALALGITPALVIGDCDSLSPTSLAHLKALHVPFQLHPQDKDESDLELALRYVTTEAQHANLGDEKALIIVATALGGRADHILTNIMLLARFHTSQTQILVFDGDATLSFLRGPEDLWIPTEVGDTLSLIPLSPSASGVSVGGTRWPLLDATLEFGSTLSLSNEATDTQVLVQLEAGLLAVGHYP